jgi:hypothetical protein
MLRLVNLNIREGLTVSQIWDEYKNGYNGGPSLEYLENTYHTKWRKGKSFDRTFLRRLVIFKKVEKLIREGSTTEEALDALETMRENLGGSLFSLSKSLKIDG